VSKKIEAIQVLRAIAALIVVARHTDSVLQPSQIPSFLSGSGCSIGVDLFFVVSGFAMALSIESSAPGAKRFFEHRLQRVLPVYFLASFPFLLINSNSDPEGFSGAQLWNTVGMVPLFDVGRYSGTLNPNGWTIGFEMVFYALLSAALSLLPRRWCCPAVAGFLLVAVASVEAFRPSNIGVQMLGSPLVLEFVAGMLLFRCRLPKSLAWPAFAIGGCLLLAAIFGSPYIIGKRDPTMEDLSVSGLRALLWGPVSALVVAAVVAVPVRWPAALVKLGDASYSIYLFQAFFMAWGRLVAWPHWSIGVMSFFVASVVCGIVCHRWIEAPLLRWMRRHSEPKTIALCASKAVPQSLPH
jgi:exopolysaccharide production protein ExoZ